MAIGIVGDAGVRCACWSCAWHVLLGFLVDAGSMYGLPPPPRLYTCCKGLVAHCRANAQQPKLFVGMILILIFAEALALYGLIGELTAAKRMADGREGLASRIVSIASIAGMPMLLVCAQFWNYELLEGLAILNLEAHCTIEVLFQLLVFVPLFCFVPLPLPQWALF
jgi:hypothetical protein